MRKLRGGIFLLVSLFIVGGLIFKGVPSVLAAQPGVNIGSHHSEFDQAANLVGPGGWVVVMATPGDCPWLSQMIKSYNVNVIIRGHYPGQNFAGQNGTNWAISWAYTLASMDTGGKKIFFMPLNEPNQTGSGDYQPQKVVIDYTNKLINQFNKLGIRGSKVELLSPMFNSNRPDVAGYINELLRQEPNFFQKFDGISMNLYDVEKNPGEVFQYPTGKIPLDNASNFGYVVSNLYHVSNKLVYGVEAGVVHPNEGVIYRDEYLKPFVEKAERSLGSVMFAVFSYDPEHQEKSWNIFKSGTAGAYHPSLDAQVTFGAPTPAPSAITTLLNKAKAEGLNLTRCHPDGCGLATSINYCSTYGEGRVSGDTSQLRIESPDGDLAPAVSDPIRLIQKEELKYPDSGPRKVTRGLFLEHFGQITLPYVKSIAQYLAGDLIYNSGQTEPSVLTKLLTQGDQDAYRKGYWLNCKNGVYCNGQNADQKKCPNQANECTILTDQGRMEITTIPLKPLAREFSEYPSYLQALKQWQKNSLSKYWKEIPLFANPVTLVNKENGGSINVNSCPSFNEQDSTVAIKVPWVRALRDVSETLNKLLVSKINDSPRNLSSTPTTKTASSLFLPSQKNNFLAQADCNHLQITGKRYKGPLCDQCDYRGFTPQPGSVPSKQVCQPPGHPPPRQLSDPQPLPIETNNGHQRLKGPTKTLFCNKWKTSVENRNGKQVTVTKCVDGLAAYNISDPLWLYVNYPYLTTIASNLVFANNGAFRIFVSDKGETARWFETGSSEISFCASIYDNALRGHFIAEGMSPDVANSFRTSVIHNVALAPYPGQAGRSYFSNNKHINQGQCALGDVVENVKIYPPYIGGIMNAVDMISQCLPTDNNESFCHR